MKKERCPGTPEVVDHELALVGIMSTGKRWVDIPNFWAVMSLKPLPANSPRAVFMRNQQAWKNQGEL
jgi:hypothetical protein